MRLPQPRTGCHLSGRGEIGAAEVLRAENLCALGDHQGQGPLGWLPRCPRSPPELERTLPPDVRWVIRPGNGKRHHVGIVDAAIDDGIQGIQIGVGRIAQHQAGRLDPQLKERPILLERHGPYLAIGPALPDR